ncbi:MAG: integrase domain-containing protein [Zoogloeaceae bacterium]|jgi:integrase|nr:integrase domain-containing protein [Zoogloeaceae bacterium]
MFTPNQTNAGLASKVLPDDVRAGLLRFIEPRIKTRVNGKVASVKTQENKRTFYLRMVGELWQMGRPIRSVENIRPDHIQLLINSWADKHISANEMHNRVSMLNHLLEWVKKGNLRVSVAVLFPLGEMRRTTIAKEDLSWSGKGIDAAEIIKEACKIDERLGCIIALIEAFGLRAKEAVEIRPFRATVEGAKHNAILVQEGTKGGLARFVSIENESQRKVLEWAIRLAGGEKNWRMRWPGKTWKEAQTYLYSMMKRLGIRRSLKGVTLHGLRHQKAHGIYRDITGLPTPIEGGALSQLDKATHQKALHRVSGQLGHRRMYIAHTYCGSYGHATRRIPDHPPARASMPTRQANPLLQKDCPSRAVSISVKATVSCKDGEDLPVSSTDSVNMGKDET